MTEDKFKNFSLVIFASLCGVYFALVIASTYIPLAVSDPKALSLLSQAGQGNTNPQTRAKFFYIISLALSVSMSAVSLHFFSKYFHRTRILFTSTLGMIPLLNNVIDHGLTIGKLDETPQHPFFIMLVVIVLLVTKRHKEKNPNP